MPGSVPCGSVSREHNTLCSGWISLKKVHLVPAMSVQAHMMAGFKPYPWSRRVAPQQRLQQAY